jgi:hypothetical protein
MASPIELYRIDAAICAATDHSSRAAVRRHNAAADRLRALVAEAYGAGPEQVAELYPLLDEAPSNRWIAFQLLELGVPPPDVAERCIKVIQQIASGQGAGAMGARIWLKEWSEKQN